VNEMVGDMDENELIFREIHHRMKNTFTILIALLHFDFRSLVTPDARQAICQFEQRILAFGSLYRTLSSGCEDGNVPVARYMEELCRALALAVLEPIGVRCDVTVDDGFLEARRCERLGLMIAELVMNAAKHAFSRTPRNSMSSGHVGDLSLLCAIRCAKTKGCATGSDCLLADCHLPLIANCLLRRRRHLSVVSLAGTGPWPARGRGRGGGDS